MRSPGAAKQPDVCTMCTTYDFDAFKMRLGSVGVKKRKNLRTKGDRHRHQGWIFCSSWPHKNSLFSASLHHQQVTEKHKT